MIALLLALASDPASVPLDARRIHDDRSCYAITMTRGEQSAPIGVTWQTIEHIDHQGRSALKVVVHQRIQGGAFDMRDTFWLDAATLVPIRLENDRKGERHVTLDYAPGRITGSRARDGAAQPVDLAAATPVYEGNLYGVTFAALPLQAGAAFTVPTYQYDKGFGAFWVRVTGEETVATPDGPVQAWTVEASSGDGPPLTYLISKADARELGYRSARGGQTLGGDCSDLM